jgi:hypothetical protein
MQAFEIEFKGLRLLATSPQLGDLLQLDAKKFPQQRNRSPQVLTFPMRVCAANKP